MASSFVAVFLRCGCGDVVASIIMRAPGGRWGAFLIIMIITFILGTFMDWVGIILLLVPICSDIVIHLGFDPIWFAVMICLNMQMLFLTPPYAPAIFFFKAAVPPEFEVDIMDMIRGVIPFVIIVMVTLVMCGVFPQIILWLPNRML